jgi:hypothetical protein
MAHGPTHSASLELKDAEFCAAMQHQLGMLLLALDTTGIRCQCAVVTSADNRDHAMMCTSMQGEATMRHDILKGLLRRAIHRCRSGAHTGADTAQAARPGGLWGYLQYSGGRPGGPWAQPAGAGVWHVVDVTIRHPSGSANRAAVAMRDGAVAARWDREKRRTYSRLEPNRCLFIFFSVMYSHLGKPAISFLYQLGTEAEEAGCTVSKSGFVPSGSLASGCSGATTRCIGRRWACSRGCQDAGSVRTPLAPLIR